MLLALDPSSTRTGWAVLDGGEVVEAGALSVPSKKGEPAAERCIRMMRAVQGLLLEWVGVDSCVIEIPSGKVNHARNQGGGSGLSVYGFAVGMIYAAVVEADGVSSAAYTAEQWTRGITKEKRKRIAARYYPAYLGMKDAGGDIADAISLGVWFLKNKD